MNQETVQATTPSSERYEFSIPCVCVRCYRLPSSWQMHMKPQAVWSTTRCTYLCVCVCMCVCVCREVDTHLFTPSELDTMARLVALPPPHLSLLLRLFFRRGPWFALSDVYEYKEVCDVYCYGAYARHTHPCCLHRPQSWAPWARVMHVQTMSY